MNNINGLYCNNDEVRNYNLILNVSNINCWYDATYETLDEIQSSSLP